MSNCLIKSHGPAFRLAKLEDHGHAVLHVVVDVAVDDPSARVVEGCSNDHISVCWYLHGVFEDRVFKVTRKTSTSVVTLGVLLDDELAGDFNLWRILTLSDDVVPTTVLVDWVGYLSIRVLVDENYFEPMTWGVWLLENVTAV